jgi:hypothetical protein
MPFVQSDSRQANSDGDDLKRGMDIQPERIAHQPLITWMEDNAGRILGNNR